MREIGDSSPPVEKRASGERSRRTWTRAGREDFVTAGVEYLIQEGDASGGAVSDGQIAATRATDGTPAELGIRLVAGLLGKSPSAPLFHFPDRLALQAAVAAAGFRRLGESLLDAGESSVAKGREPIDVLADIGLAYVDWAGRYPLLFSAMYAPAMAPGVDAIQSGDEVYWTTVHDGDDASAALTEPQAKRRLAFDELHAAKTDCLTVFLSAATSAHAIGSIARELALIDVVNTIIALADGLATQRITEFQQSENLMRAHATRCFAILTRGIAAGPR